MECRHDRDRDPGSFERRPDSAQPRDAELRSKKELRGRPAERDENARSDDPDLFDEERSAPVDLVLEGRPVVRRARLQDVRDVDRRTIETLSLIHISQGIVR